MFLFGAFFFFSSRRRHTRFDCDWSSDVCSSDLLPIELRDRPAGAELTYREVGATAGGLPAGGVRRGAGWGRVEVSGGAGSFKKKKKMRSTGEYRVPIFRLL